MAELVRKAVEVEADKEVVDGLSTHLGNELVRVVVVEELVFFRQAFDDVEILLFSEKVEFFDAFDVAGVSDDVAFVVNDSIEFLRRQAEEIADFVRQRTEVPDVGNGNDELDVAHAFAANFLFGNFYTATVADNAFVADALVLSAMTFVVLNRAEDAFAEKAVALGLVCAVVDGLRFENLTA